ncbi:acyl-CoA dehydrogenase family protein [Caproicibacterium lactatifermentans]|uniref:acyl-CoA dehydrogenase family protein n=1 Tax=Caproicibacterium lactatifermentans TaxID=2666138 RepID=UPI003D9340B0
MFYQTTNEQEALRTKVRSFAESDIKPQAFLLDKGNTFPKETVKKMAELGLMGLPYDTRFGGAGLDMVCYAIAVEELSRVDGGVGIILSAHTSLGTWPIDAFGTESQKQKYLVPLCRGDKLGAFGLTEQNAGSDAAGMEMTAVRHGDYYILNGSKIFITNGGEADTYVVFAVTQPGNGVHGISAFIVEKGWEGLTFGEHYDKMGIRSSATCELHFQNVKVPKENLLDKEGEGFSIAMKTLDGGRIGIAAQALGIAQGAYEAALDYAKERVQFGKPICQQQSIAFKLADMATKLRASRLLVYSAAELKQSHADYSKEAAMAKQFASDAALEITNDALQIFGGSGYLKGMDVERFYRDAKITSIYEGTNEIQRMVIASHILSTAKKEPPAEKKLTAAQRLLARAAKYAQPVQTAGTRKCILLKKGTAEERVDSLVKNLRQEGIDFTVGMPIDTPIAKADRVVSAGLGIGARENMKLIEDLAKAAGAAVGSSRPVAESLKYVPIDRFIGISGQKFHGSLYIACGISGAGQHLKGIQDATLVVAINTDEDANIFKNCDYGIVGDIKEILPLLTKALDTGAPKKPEAPLPKAAPAPAPAPRKIYVCSGCGYEYDPAKGDPESGILPGTPFEDLPAGWTCPYCGATKEEFIETVV